VNRLRVALVVLLAGVVVGRPGSAQVLALSIFERYLDALRIEAAIPGLSAAIVQNGVVVWDRGFGRQDVEANIAARSDTPYVIGDLSQTLGATLTLKVCVDESYAEVEDVVRRWYPAYPEPATTLEDLLAHRSPLRAFRYAPDRFAALTPVAEECADVPYRKLLDEQVFQRLGMADSVPGHALVSPTADDVGVLGADRVARYQSVLSRLAVPYRVDANGRVSRSTVTPSAVDASTGIVSTVLDLAKFDRALDDAGVLLSAELRERAWTAVPGLPTGLGWFVQAYNGERIVWHFGLVRDAYSSLMIKVPSRRLTLILLANSDRLTAPFALDNGDVRSSLFAQLFLRLLIG
jgi:CubicO group peptidase (beta-lactamase class C family)